MPRSARALATSPTYTLSWTGYDWDGGGEEALYLNGQFLASLPATDSPANGGVWASFTLDITSLIVNGTNTLTFTHAPWDCSVSDDVKDLQVTTGSAIVYSSSTQFPLSCTQSLTYSFDPQLDPSPWPMFHQNPQHTGLSPFPGPASPSLKWKFQAGGRIDSTPAIGHNRIYVTSEDGNLYALNLDGQLQWTFSTGWPLRSSPAIGTDGTIYVGGCAPCGGSAPPQGELYAITPGGDLKWNLTIPNSGEGIDTISSPTVGPDGTIYLSNNGFRIVAVSPDGTIKWQVATAGEVVGPPAVASDGTIYVQVDDPPPPPQSCQVLNKCLVALNPDGTIKWTWLDYGGFDSPSVGSEGTVYIDGSAASPNGTVLWQDPGTFSSPSVGSDGTIYGTVDGNLSAVNPDGTVQWQFPLEKGGGSGNPCCSYTIAQPSDVAIGSNGLLYFGFGVTYRPPNQQPGNGNATLYAVNLDGTLAWTLDLESNVSICGGFNCPVVVLTAPAIGLDNTIYVASNDGNLYAVA